MNGETAYVQNYELTEYLLSRTHRDRKYKVELLRAVEFNKVHINILI